MSRPERIRTSIQANPHFTAGEKFDQGVVLNASLQLGEKSFVPEINLVHVRVGGVDLGYSSPKRCL